MANRTDGEIIKVFEEKVKLIGSMEAVYLDEDEGYALYCAMSDILRLVNRQQAKIENLQNDYD